MAKDPLFLDPEIKFDLPEQNNQTEQPTQRIEGPQQPRPASTYERMRQGILQRRAAQSQPANILPTPTESLISPDRSQSFAPFEKSTPITEPKFDKALANTLGYEGAGIDYNEVGDSGISQLGVTQKAWDAYADKIKAPRKSVTKLSNDERKSFYKDEYAKPLNLENLPDEVAMVAFDYGVNAGPGRAARDLQTVLGVKADGQIGPKTLAAIKNQNPKALAEKLLAMQEHHYVNLVKQNPAKYGKFAKGWQNRIDAQRQKLQLGNFAQKMAVALKIEKDLPQYKYPDDPDVKVKYNLWLWQTVTGIDKMMEQAARIPAYAYDFFAIPQNFYAEVLHQPGLATQAPDWLMNNPVAEYYRRSAELANKMDERFGYVTERDENGMLIKRVKNFDDLVKEGDAKEAAEYIGWQILTNAPQQLMVLAFYEARLADLGLNVMGALSAAGANYENTWEPSKTPGGKPVRKKLDGYELIIANLNATFHGATDIYTEKMWGTGKAFNTMKEKLMERFGAVATKGIIKDASKIILKGASSEFVEEYVASLSQDFADWAMGTNPNALKGMWGRALEAGLIGAGSSFSMTAPAAGVSAASQIRAEKSQANAERIKAMGRSGEVKPVDVPGPGRMVTPRRLKEMAQNRLDQLNAEARGQKGTIDTEMPDPDRPGQKMTIPGAPSKDGRILTSLEMAERKFLRDALEKEDIESIAKEYGYGLKTPTQSGADAQSTPDQVIEGELYQAQKQAEENPVKDGEFFKINDPHITEEILESTKKLAQTLRDGDVYESATGDKLTLQVSKRGSIGLTSEDGKVFIPILDKSKGEDANGVSRITSRWRNEGLSALARGRVLRPAGESARYKVAEEDDTAETLIFVSPSIETSDAADMVNRENVTTLYKKTNGGKHASFKSAIRGVMIDLGVPADVSSALGIWEDGGEDTVIARLPEGTDIDTIKYLGAQAAKLYPQKAYLWFKPKKSGKNHMTKMTLPLKYDEAVGILLRNGIKFATVVPTKDGTEVYQFHDDKSQLKHSASVAKSMGGAIEMTSGDGGFVGGETRASAVAQYNKDIKESRTRIIAKSLKEAKDVLRRKKKSLAETNARRAGKGVEGDSRADSRSKRPQGVLVGAEESLDQAGKLKVFQVAKAIAKALDVRYIGRDATPDQKKQRYKEGLRRFYELARQSGRDVKEREFYAVAANKAIAQLIDTTFPELADPDKQGIFKVLLAITSNGNLVSLNTKYAMDQMRHYLDTGDFNTKTVYARNEISAHLKKLQELIDEYGEVEAINHLTEYQKQLTPTGKQSAEPDAPRAVDYFGDKIGRYFTNVFGLGREVTIDLWQTRLYHILMGDIKSFYEVSVKRNKKGDFETGNVFPKVVESPGKVEKRIMREAITELAKELGETPADLQSISWHEIKQLYAKFSGTDVEIMDYNDAVTDILEDSDANDDQGDVRFSRPGTDELGNELGYEEEQRRNKEGREFYAKYLPEFVGLLENPAYLTTDSGMRLLGMFQNGVTKIVSGQPLPIYKHEGFHNFVWAFATDKEILQAWDAIKIEYAGSVQEYMDKYDVSEDRAAEEVMAELMEHVDNNTPQYAGKTIPQKLVTFFRKLIQKIRAFFGHPMSQIQELQDAFYEMRRTPSQARMAEERYLYGGQRAVGYDDLAEEEKFVAPDRRVRFEIPDKDAELTFKNDVENLAKEAERLKTDDSIHWQDKRRQFDAIKKKLESTIKSKRTLGSMLDHPELYKRYPWAKDIPILIKRLSGGTVGLAYNAYAMLSPEGSHIRITSKYLDNLTALYSNTQMQTYEQFRKTLLHEVQHMIQAYENFAQGGTTKEGLMTYLRLLGEVESRDVEARSRMTDEQRRAAEAYMSQVDPVEAATRDNWKRKIGSLNDVIIRQTGNVNFETPKIYAPGQSRAAQIAKYFFKKTPSDLPTKPVTVYAIRVADGANAGKDFSTFPSIQIAGETFESKSAALAALKNLDIRMDERKKRYLKDYGDAGQKQEEIKGYVIQETHRTDKKPGLQYDPATDKWVPSEYFEETRVIDRKIVATEEDAAKFDETKILEELQRRMVGEKKKAIRSESSEPMYKIDERDNEILKDIEQKMKYGGYDQQKIKTEYAERGINVEFKEKAIRISPSKVKAQLIDLTGQTKSTDMKNLRISLNAQARAARGAASFTTQELNELKKGMAETVKEYVPEHKQGDYLSDIASAKDGKDILKLIVKIDKAERKAIMEGSTVKIQKPIKQIIRETTGQTQDQDAKDLAEILAAQEEASQLGFKLGVKTGMEKVKSAKQILARRVARIAGIRDMYGLSDADLKKINRKEIRLMTDYEFHNLIQKIDAMAARYTTTRDMKNQVLFTIHDLELKKVENLIKAMKLPNLDDMNAEQLDELNDALMEFQKGDEFLSVRKLETVKNTELAGIKTLREAKEALAKKLGVPLEKVNNIQVSALDKFRYDTALARQNPFYQLLVDETNMSMLEAEQKFLDMEEEVDDLTRAARKSRKKSLLDVVAPTDKFVFQWLEADQSQKQSLARQMTPEEIALASYLQARFAQFRDYLVQQGTLKKYRENYITHIRRGFLETVKADGIVSAFKEVFTQAKEDQVMFRILDDDTQNILPLEKFFQFAMQRSGELKPSENVSIAFKAYTKAMLKKQALDKIVPALEIYAEALSPKAKTPKGLEMDTRLKKFTKEWINNKKGRKTSFGGAIPQGGIVDIGLRSINGLITLIDLGLNIPVGLSSNVGEQVVTYVNMGEKAYATGIARLATPKGQKIINDNRAFVGKSLWSELMETSNTIGNTFQKVLFGLFHTSSVNANKIHLLGSLTAKEWADGKISVERLAQIKRDMGRFRAIEGAKSVAGSTSLGSALTKYKTWAIPVLTTAIDDIAKMTAMISKGDAKGLIQSREFQEVFRGTLLTSLVVVAGAGMFGDDDDDKSFTGEVLRKAYRETMTLIGALNPSLYTSVRMLSFLKDLSQGLVTIRDRYKTKGREHEFKGLNLLKRTLTPRVVKSMIPEPQKKKKALFL